MDQVLLAKDPPHDEESTELPWCSEVLVANRAIVVGKRRKMLMPKKHSSRTPF